jgi:trehalose-6-phosphatase
VPLPVLLQPGVGLAAEHGFFIRPPWRSRWHSRFPLADHSWQAMVLPILKQVRLERVVFFYYETLHASTAITA